jgi:hypothetical protein
VLLGAAFGGLCGASLETLLYNFFGTPFGLFFGAIAGAAAGLLLGVFDGLTLRALPCVLERCRGSYNDTPAETRVLRRLGTISCAVATLASLFLDWLLNGLPDPDGFATSRVVRLLLSHEGGYGGVQADAFTLTIWVFSWLTGRFVAGWYTNTVLET